MAPVRIAFAACLGAAALGSGMPGTAAQPVEKQRIVTITAEQVKGGIVSELTWVNGVLTVQSAYIDPLGRIQAEYHVIPAEGTELRRLAGPSAAAEAYWKRKSNRLSPTGLGRITGASDSKMPYMGIGSLDRRLSDAVDMGGVQQQHVLRLNALVLHERSGPAPPYDGETYSWSPAELNRLAYVDAKGDLWVAHADGTGPQRLLKGDYSLPAWSDDGRAIAVAERKDGGRRWEISVVYLPEPLRSPRR